MVWEEILSCSHMCEWSTTGDNGRSNEQGDNDQWLLDLWFHYNAMEEGISNLKYVCWLVLLAVHVFLIICNLKVEQHTIVCVQLIICMNSVHNTEFDRVWFNSCCLLWFSIILWNFIFQLPLPDSVTERRFHSLSTLQLSPHTVWLIVFGGRRSSTGATISHTIIVELCEY